MYFYLNSKALYNINCECKIDELMEKEDPINFLDVFFI